MEWIVEAECREELVEGHWFGGEELVRCKDCKYWNPANDDSSGERCELLAALLNPNEDDYCSCGERKQ